MQTDERLAKIIAAKSKAPAAIDNTLESNRCRFVGLGTARGPPPRSLPGRFTGSKDRNENNRKKGKWHERSNKLLSA